MRRLVVLIVLAVTTTLSVACGSTPDTQVRVSDSGPAADSSASGRPPCHDGDIAKERTYEYGVDPPGGPTTPEAALQAEFEKRYPGLGPERFSRSDRANANGDRQSVFTYDDADGGARVTTEFTGDSWHVTQFSICGATALKERAPK